MRISCAAPQAKPADHVIPPARNPAQNSHSEVRSPPKEAAILPPMAANQRIALGEASASPKPVAKSFPCAGGVFARSGFFGFIISWIIRQARNKRAHVPIIHKARRTGLH